MPPGKTPTPEPSPTIEAESTVEATPEAAPTAEMAVKPLEEAAANSGTTNGVCVIVYEDTDADAVYFIENENLLADAAVTLFRDGKNEALFCDGWH
ncbi:MAG: hypothetical protein M5U34_40625 [Chloroflexi bacterium]|nr:hypothetical protein [Chloroflexota bacterium]